MPYRTRSVRKALYQGTTLQSAEKLVFETGSYQGMTLQGAEKLAFATVSYQGTTSVVPQSVDNKRWGFRGC